MLGTQGWRRQPLEGSFSSGAHREGYEEHERVAWSAAESRGRAERRGLEMRHVRRAADGRRVHNRGSTRERVQQACAAARACEVCS